MIRTATLLSLTLIVASAARADELRGRVVTTESGAVRVGEEYVFGPLAASLTHLAGREVTLELAREPSGRRVVRRIAAPERLELRGQRKGDRLLTAEQGRLRLAGPGAALVPDGRVVVVDAFLCGREAVVVAVEGRTTADWNLVHIASRWNTPSDVIRSQRPVWIVGRRDGRWLIRRGDTRGWIAADGVVVGEAPTPGLVDALPR